MKIYAAALLVALAIPASAEVLVAWDFNTDDGSVSTGTLTPTAGSGSLTLVGGATAFFTSGSPSDPAAFPTDSSWSVGGFPAQGVASGTAGFVLSVSTVGYKDITLSFDFRNQPSSSKFYSIDTSIDGGLTWTSTQQLSVDATNTWFTLSRDVPFLYDQANVAIKVAAMFAPGTMAYEATEAGYNGDFGLQIDRLEVVATPVPEPSTYALLLAGLIGIGHIARRRR